jgi:hypothetical protein
MVSTKNTKGFQISESLDLSGAEGGTRTHTLLPTLDFESSAVPIRVKMGNVGISAFSPALAISGHVIIW